MEIIHVDIEFNSITDTNINPYVEVLLNEKICFARTEIASTKKISFDLNLESNQTYQLIIDRTNHNNKGKQVLIIKKLEIDSINLNKILDNVYFYPEYPTKWYQEQIKTGNKWDKKQKGWRELGFNGKWVMEFDTPFYAWLLKNT